MLMKILVVMIASMLGGLVQTVTGFGGGIVIMLFLPSLMPVLQASGLNVLITMILNLMLVITFRKFVQLRLVVLPGLISFVSGTLCIYLGSNLELDAVKMIFGVFLIGLALYFIFFADRIHLKVNLPTLAVCAALAGGANGLFGIGGPPMALYYLTVTESKESYIGTTQAYFLVTNIFTTVIRLTSGILDRELMLTAIPGIAAILAGEYIGVRVVSLVSLGRIKGVIYFFLLLCGVITLVQTI